MRQLILVLLIQALLSCSEIQKAGDNKYNPKAIELNNKAVKLSHSFKQDSALLLYDKAIEIDENYYLPHSNKVEIYLSRKEYDKALYESEMVIKKKPDLAESWFFAGLLNEIQGNTKKAMIYYKKSIEIFTNRINNPEKKADINANKLNRALSKKILGDETYLKDFEELRKNENYSFLIDQFKNKSKKEIMNELIN